MFRSSAARLRSLLGPQRKLFLLVFLWTCLCLVIFKSSLFGSPSQSSQAQPGDRQKVRARSASSDYPAPLSLELEPEFALPDNGNSNAVYYSLSALSSSSSSSSSPTISARSHQEASQTAQPKTPAIKSDTKKPKSTHKAGKQRIASHDDTAHFVTGSQCDYDYPSLFDLQFNNIHWQKMTTTTSSSSNASTTTNSQLQTATYYLYNAYYDDRWRAGLPSVRVLAMIDRIQPPPTNCLLWPSKSKQANGQRARPLVTRATFVYAWYPKWGNYKDGILQPWIVTCAIPKGRVGFVPDSVSLVGVPPEIRDDQDDQPEEERSKRDASSENSAAIAASIAMPPSFSSSSPALANAESSSSSSSSTQTSEQHQTKPMKSVQYDCKQVLPITNNLPVFNSRPKVKQKFAVCVKGLDFPHDDVSVRLVEWIEMLNLLGAGKIFLYNLDVHENISKVLHYYEKRGIVELSPLTLPGDQPNLPEYQHLYLKNRLTAKRQNELIPYNDCLYRNLYSYQYLALLDIDEIIMPLKQEHNNWLDLMQEVEWASLYEQNYSRASYNVRNVYFFDDLSGPLGTTAASTTLAGHQLTSANDNDLSSVGSSSSSSPLLLERNNDVVSQTNGVDGSRGEAGSTGTTGDDDSDDHDDDDGGAGQVENEQEAFNDNNKNSNHRQHPESLERGIPHYLHMMSHVYRSKNYTEPGQYVKCFHNTERVVSLHNHFPMNCFGQCTTYSIPVSMAHLQHYRKDCVGPLKQSCKNNFRVFTTRDTTIWKYKQRMIRRTTRVLNHLGLLSSSSSSSSSPTGKSL